MKNFSFFQSRTALAALLLLVSIVAHTQTIHPPPCHKEIVVENPNAVADMKVVGDFINALASGDTLKAKSLMAADYMAYGPAHSDSNNAQQVIAHWQKRYETN